MAQVYYDADADLSNLEGLTTAIIGFGNQGHAHALNLRDSGARVIVGARKGRAGLLEAERAGLEITTVEQATRQAQMIMILVPDNAQAELFAASIRPNLEPGSTLLFAHGFAIRFGLIKPPAEVDIAMIAPKAPGRLVRSLYVGGGGAPALVAIERDATGAALPRALAYARALGCTRAGVLATTFAEETETDLFGEQAVLCGGLSALVRAGYETLVDAGYQPEVAYFECLHELKLIVDLIYQGGLTTMWRSVSDTAEHGGYHAGAHIIGDQARGAMKALLDDIRSGIYAATCLRDTSGGAEGFVRRRLREQRHPVEMVGSELRRMMPFLEGHQASSAATKAPVSASG